jgi:hypothetical protein
MTAGARGRFRSTAARGTVNYRHTDQPVWRGSFDIHDRRADVGRRFGDGSVEQSHRAIDAIIEAITDWAEKIKVPGKPHPLTRNVIKTLEDTLRMCMDFKTGACEATYEIIKKVTQFGRQTVIRHMKILRAYNLFHWVRRTERTGKAPGEGPQVKQAPNSYFFELSTLPHELQIHMRQILKRLKVKIEEHRDRVASIPAPNRAVRLAERLGRTMGKKAGGLRSDAEIADLMAEADFIRGEAEFFGDIPVEQWAALAHPGDPAAQDAYDTRIGFRRNTSASTETHLQSPHAELK